MKEDNDTQILFDKAKIFFDNHMPVHITMKVRAWEEKGEWHNGDIVEFDKDFFMLNERKKGMIPVFFKEILNIEKFEVKE